MEFGIDVRFDARQQLYSILKEVVIYIVFYKDMLNISNVLSIFYRNFNAIEFPIPQDSHHILQILMGFVFK